MKRKTFIYTFVLGTGGLMFNKKLGGMIAAESDMRIRMIYNNTGKAEGLKNAWGLSAWIESADGITLFDTGGKAATLLENMLFLGLDYNKIKKVVISHDHWDHNGGLGILLEKMYKPADVYVTHNTQAEYQERYNDAKVIGLDKPAEIAHGIWSTGSFPTGDDSNDLHEQSLILSTDDSMILLTGCSHPGIVKIAQKAIDLHPDKKFKLVTGGFHLRSASIEEVGQISKDLKDLGIEYVAPSHCTGEKAIQIFREEWGENFIEMNIGDEQFLSLN